MIASVSAACIISCQCQIFKTIFFIIYARNVEWIFLILSKCILWHISIKPPRCSISPAMVYFSCFCWPKCPFHLSFYCPILALIRLLILNISQFEACSVFAFSYIISFPSHYWLAANDVLKLFQRNKRFGKFYCFYSVTFWEMRRFTVFVVILLLGFLEQWIDFKF